jgi:hypothetical protein
VKSVLALFLVLLSFQLNAATYVQCSGELKERNADCLTAEEIAKAKAYGLSQEAFLKSIRTGLREKAMRISLARELKECLANNKKEIILDQLANLLSVEQINGFERASSVSDYENLIFDMGSLDSNAQMKRLEQTILMTCRWEKK